jgi:hypothetical protein
MWASPASSFGMISETLSTASITRATPSSSANARTRSYSGPIGPSGLIVYAVGLLRVTTRSSPVSSTWSSSGGGDEHVPTSPASMMISNTRIAGSRFGVQRLWHRQGPNGALTFRGLLTNIVAPTDAGQPLCSAHVPANTDHGEVPEWSNGPDSKSGVRLHRTVGSNPTLSARKQKWAPLRGPFCFPAECGMGFRTVLIVAGALGS